MNEFGEHMKKFYPELKDIEEAFSLIQNGLLFGHFDQLPILSKEEIKQLLELLYKWNKNYKQYKEDSINEIIKEINEKG
jgi:hypothetical protein